MNAESTISKLIESRRNERRIDTTAKELARALYGIDVSGLSKGFYQGTKISLRKVTPNAKVTLSAWGGGGNVEDFDGGWIADRFGPELGHRDANRAMDLLLKRK